MYQLNPVTPASGILTDGVLLLTHLGSAPGLELGALKVLHLQCGLAREAAGCLRLEPHARISYTVVPKLQLVSEWRACPQKFGFSRSGTGMGICVSSQFPDGTGAALGRSHFENHKATLEPHC